MPPYVYPKWGRGIVDNPIHVYRRLMRHSRSLQDDVARAYFPAYIRSRFEANRSEVGKRLVQNISDARHGARILEKANMGVFGSLTKVLEYAYGRSGKRRHELLEPILNYNKPPPVKGDTYTEPWISEKMRALLTWAKVKHQKAVVPETNSFGAPLTNERKIRMKHLQFTKLHAACPAPLPKEEYERLRRFALGEESSRPPPRVPFYSQEFGLGPHERPRQMTMRSWRRMYLRVYEKTPMLQQNPATQKWEVTPKEYIPIPEADPEDCEDISEQAVPRRSKPGSRA